MAKQVVDKNTGAGRMKKSEKQRPIEIPVKTDAPKEWTLLSLLLGRQWHSLERLFALLLLMSFFFLGYSLIIREGKNVDGIVSICLALLGYLAGFNTPRR